MTEQWAVFSQAPGNLSVYRVLSLTARRLTWRRPNGGCRWVHAAMVHGLFPSFHTADDARQAARRALADGDLIAAKQAIKNAPKYNAP